NGYSVETMTMKEGRSCYKFNGLKSYQSIKNECTFKVLASSHYKLFQDYMNSTNYSANEVYGNQDICPHELPLSEYREFGTLRSGAYLQWHNIYRALSQGTLSFDQPSVVNLICQAIWEAGAVESETGTRQPILPILDDTFISAMIDLL